MGMWLSLDDLRCGSCDAFVHPLLDRCPACGGTHVSRRPEAAAGPIGAVRLAEAPETQRVASNLTTRYTMKVNAVGSSAVDATLVDAVAHLADALSYRVSGDAISNADDASVSLRDGELVIQRRPSATLLGRIPIRSIVASAARHREVTLYYAAGGPDPADGPIGAPMPAGPARITIGNRAGLLAPRARDDHYRSLACWLGVLAAADGERRWTEVGLPGYLAELGLAAGDPSAPAVDRDRPPRRPRRPRRRRACPRACPPSRSRRASSSSRGCGPPGWSGRTSTPTSAARSSPASEARRRPRPVPRGGELCNVPLRTPVLYDGRFRGSCAGKVDPQGAAGRTPPTTCGPA